MTLGSLPEDCWRVTHWHGADAFDLWIGMRVWIACPGNRFHREPGEIVGLDVAARGAPLLRVIVALPQRRVSLAFRPELVSSRRPGVHFSRPLTLRVVAGRDLEPLEMIGA